VGRRWANGGPVVDQWWANVRSMVTQWWANGGPVVGRRYNHWWTNGGSMVDQRWTIDITLVDQWQVKGGPKLLCNVVPDVPQDALHWMKSIPLIRYTLNEMSSVWPL